MFILDSCIASDNKLLLGGGQRQGLRFGGLRFWVWACQDLQAGVRGSGVRHVRVDEFWVWVGLRLSLPSP